MPSRACKHATCTNYIPAKLRNRFCFEHRDEERDVRREGDRAYDRTTRDPEAKRFYNSAIWLAARAAVLAMYPICQRCMSAWSQHVHHRVPLSRCTIAQRTDPENLMAVCPPCHGEIEAEVRALESACSSS